MNSFSGQREAYSLELSVTARTPVATVCPTSPERSLSPGKVAEPPGKNLWEQICEGYKLLKVKNSRFFHSCVYHHHLSCRKQHCLAELSNVVATRHMWLFQPLKCEYEAELPPFPEEYKIKPETVITVSPMEETVFHGFNTEHLYSVPHLIMNSHIPCTQETVDPKTCSPKEYLETFIFPVLLPGIASLLHQAKKEKCFERKRTKFIACDFLTEWLYNPRPPIPLSLRLTEEEAALSIQSFWRAYLELESEKQGCQQPSCLCVKNLWRNYCRGSRAERQRREGLSLRTVLEHLDSAVSVRCDPEIQELRQWQKKLREDKHIRERVKIFWAKQERKVKYKMEEEEEEESIAATPAP
ncbi:IQ domain-containing protein K isoform X2 [Desmodus rotundus]|uniref:IQ domain-containing protein K isoform X2 n=1 Tax=Desmodus rotundus TaxID=9430 RepID=UPI0023814CC3|nr:IQ domain-containing protein K isoform X2 [Desmodus rotundus]